ncbi:MAG: hypothetical protein U0802_26390 [Candidatus Binatia bacterium]
MRHLALLLALALAGCAGGDNAIAEPAWGTATCAHCRAVITEQRHAAQMRSADGAVLAFDDPACLFRALAASAPPRAVRFHGPGAGEWIEGSAAWFARVPGQPTPRGDGWAAYPSFAAAQDAVAQAGGGEILPFDQVRQRIAP